MKYERWIYRDKADGSLLIAQTEDWLRAESSHGLEFIKHISGLDEEELVKLYILSVRYKGNDPRFFMELDNLIK